MILSILNDQFHNDAVSKAAESLRMGKFVVYPTDTAYALGANAMHTGAVTKLYELKSRTYNKPTHVIVRDWQMITELCEVSDDAWKLFNIFMPGPLTIVLKSKSKVDTQLEAGTGTLGVRIPNCKFTLALSQAVDFAYTTPSANVSGGITPYSITEVDLDLAKVGIVIDSGVLPKVLPSTVIDLSDGSLRVVREGPISISDIKAVLSGN